jgi:6-pyruvoyltetrahydropterin/6-carboxytetrahydropterin synthase
MRLTRRYRFSSSHRLHTPALSAAENAQVYGKCNNPFGHGHDYILEVTVRGALDPDTGRVIDLERLDDLVSREVVGAFEHKNLNLDLPEFAVRVPTSENVAVVAVALLRKAWSTAFGSVPALERIRIHETRRNIFETRI